MLLSLVLGLVFGYLRRSTKQTVVIGVLVAGLLAAFSLFPYNCFHFCYFSPFSYPFHAITFEGFMHTRRYLIFAFMDRQVTVFWFDGASSPLLTAFTLFLAFDLIATFLGIGMGRAVQKRLRFESKGSS